MSVDSSRHVTINLYLKQPENIPSMGPTVTRPVQDPLAVLLLENRLYMY